MKTDLADGQTLKEMLASGTVWLGKSAPDINAINVFPVPDGDTGTNMVLTMKFAMEEAKRNSDNRVSSAAKSLAHGALMGARGNSGVILSQFFRGLAKGLDGALQFIKGESHKMQYRKPRLVVAEAAIASRAARETCLEGLEIRKGQFIAILGDEELIARADKIGDVILEAVGKAGAEEAGIVTIYYGAEINSAEAQQIAQEIRDRYHTEVEVVYGGQPHYNYIISLE